MQPNLFHISWMKFQNETMMVLFEGEMFSSGSCVWTLGSWWVVLFWKVVEPLVEELYWSNCDPSGRASLGILWPCLLPVHFLCPDSDCGTVILLLLLHCFPTHDWLYSLKQQATTNSFALYVVVYGGCLAITIRKSS